MINDHQVDVIVTTPACPLCGDVGTVRVDRAELQEWLDGGGPVMAAFPSLNNDDHLRLVTGIHQDCPAAALDQEATG